MDASEPTPADAAAFNDELERRLRALGDPVLRRIALCKLEGYTNKEIARELDNCTERTIERKLVRIRTRWARSTSRASDMAAATVGRCEMRRMKIIGHGHFRGGADMSGESDDDSSLIDLAADRFERAWLAGEAPRIEDYLDGAAGTSRLAPLRGAAPGRAGITMRGRLPAEPGRVSPPVPRSG